MHTDMLDTLEANLHRLPFSDYDFAASLIAQGRRRGLTEKQMVWVQKLARRATGQDPGPSVDLGDMTGLIDLFAKASQHLKHPAIVIGSPVGELRITVAGERARCPGTVNVATSGRFGENTWFGRIDLEGVFTINQSAEVSVELIEFLREFAADPAKVASAHGHQTGCCCFCNRPLTDQRSVSVGYGPTCAANYGLAWGSIKATHRAEAA
jgi:hypothetical protein